MASNKLSNTTECGPDKAKAIMATVYLQAQIVGHVFDTDKVLEIDVTSLVLKSCLQDIHALADNDYSSDQLAIASAALIDHASAFRVEVEDSVLEYFDIDVLDELTQAQLDAAAAANEGSVTDSIYEAIRSSASLLQLSDRCLPDREVVSIQTAIESGHVRGVGGSFGVQFDADSVFGAQCPTLGLVCMEAMNRGYDRVELLSRNATQ